MKKTEFLLSILLLIILFSCGKDEDPITIPEPQLSSKSEISKLVLEQNNLEYLTSISGNEIQVNEKLPYGTESIQIKSIEVSDKSAANVKAGDFFNISSGNFKINVTAENGNSKEYTVNITFEERKFEVTIFEPLMVSKSYTTPTYVHYMPWFESPEFAEFPNTERGNWGIHWTMSTKDPSNVDANGKREIAAHYYPLIGPYDNGEPHYLEYAVTCIKLAGLDGILIDNPGITEVYDARLLQEHTEAIIPWLKKAGLKFGLVYEDAALKNAEEQGVITDKVLEGKRVLSYMQDNYFDTDDYVNINNRPLLLNFAPQGIFTASEWESIFSDITPKPLFVTLPYTINNYNLNDVGAGEFGWVGESVNNDFNTYCQNSNFSLCIGGAIPGFNDFYMEGGWGDGFTYYDDMGGLLFEQSLQQVKTNDIDLLQIITWNDWGEGTIIEPSEEFGYSRLETLQNFLGVQYSENELELPVKLYQKRKEYKGKIFENQVLDQVFYYLVSLQIEEAKKLLDEI